MLSLFLLVSVSSGAVPEFLNNKEECMYLKNISEYQDISAPAIFDSAEEECVFYYILYKVNGNFRSIRNLPPPEKDISITVFDLRIEHVELAKGSSYQFNIDGFMDLGWFDSRLTWNVDDLKTSMLVLNNPRQIWTPTIDHTLCTDKTTCDLTFLDVEVQSDGSVQARLHFRYASFCSLDFYRYPEEENNCCIYFTAYERMRMINFTQMDDKVSKPRKVVMKESLDTDAAISRLTQDHSAWIIVEQTYGVTHIETLPTLKVCVTAAKKMSTLKMAIRLPVTIATLLMLLAPLFGDLRTQALIKLVTMCIQTICFLYLCSMAPENGFAGQKPKIYRFYESMFMLTTVSMLITVCCIALSRAKRTVPPSHRLYLCAKLVNRTVCCIEPEDAATYQRYLENNENQHASHETDYTQDWRHIYLAINNLISGLFFTTFLFFVILDMM